VEEVHVPERVEGGKEMERESKRRSWRHLLSHSTNINWIRRCGRQRACLEHLEGKDPSLYPVFN
jgi:hypothetical protein